MEATFLVQYNASPVQAKDKQVAEGPSGPGKMDVQAETCSETNFDRDGLVLAHRRQHSFDTTKKQSSVSTVTVNLRLVCATGEIYSLLEKKTDHTRLGSYTSRLGCILYRPRYYRRQSN